MSENQNRKMYNFRLRKIDRSGTFWDTLCIFQSEYREKSYKTFSSLNLIVRSYTYTEYNFCLTLSVRREFFCTLTFTTDRDSDLRFDILLNYHFRRCW